MTVFTSEILDKIKNDIHTCESIRIMFAAMSDYKYHFHKSNLMINNNSLNIVAEFSYLFSSDGPLTKEFTYDIDDNFILFAKHLEKEQRERPVGITVHPLDNDLEDIKKYYKAHNGAL